MTRHRRRPADTPEEIAALWRRTSAAHLDQPLEVVRSQASVVAGGQGIEKNTSRITTTTLTTRQNQTRSTDNGASAMSAWA